jgi:hypothetical protein
MARSKRQRKTVIDGPFTETKELIGGTARPDDPGPAEEGEDRPQ